MAESPPSPPLTGNINYYNLLNYQPLFGKNKIEMLAFKKEIGDKAARKIQLWYRAKKQQVVSTPTSTASSESVEYEQCMSVYVFSEVAGYGYKKVDGIHIQTYCGGPEGGYLMSVAGQLYSVHRNWGIPFELTKIEGTLVLQTEGDPDRIRLVKVGEELLEDEIEFDWEEWHQEKWAKAKENYEEACMEEEYASASEENSATPKSSEPATPKSPVPNTKNHVRVVHTTDFNVPDDLDLHDETQVVQWNVKDNLLYIEKADGSELFIDPRDEGDVEVTFEMEGRDF